jgi:hypothetical protein
VVFLFFFFFLWWLDVVLIYFFADVAADYNRVAYLPVPPGGVVWKGFTPIPTPTTSGVPVATAT